MENKPSGKTIHIQWQIQDFPGGTNSKGGDPNLISWPIFPENCKTIFFNGPTGRARVPLGSTNDGYKGLFLATKVYQQSFGQESLFVNWEHAIDSNS